MEKSLIDYAFDFIKSKKEPVSFAEIWAYVVKNAGLSDEEAADKVSRFYTNLMLDGRFVTLGENSWDLRVRHTFDKVHIDMKDVYSDDEDEEIDVDAEELDSDEIEAYEEEKDEDSDDSASSDSEEDGEEETL